MQTQQLFIPDKINVGFQKRTDTYTGQLAYIIYFDKKGVLRKETSWQSWRDNKIDPVQFENTPTEGFVLNKGVGGARQSYGWNARNEYIRVYDPRDFEFEISLANLLFILKEGDCSRGKGLEGKFVYAWDKNNLVLLPVSSQDYKISASFTDLQDKTVSVKDLVPGASYLTRKQEQLIYLGRFIKHSYESYRGKPPEKPAKKFVFWDGKNFVFLNEIKSIAVRQGDGVTADFAELVDKYNNSFYNSKAVELFTKKKVSRKKQDQEYWAVPEGDGFLMFQSQYGWDYENQQQKNEVESIYCHQKISLKDGHVNFEYRYKRAYRKGTNPYGQRNDMKWIEPTSDRLWVRLESGAEYPVGQNQLIINEKEE
jgi:hypothetical protein